MGQEDLVGLLLLNVGVVLILEHGLDVPPHQRQEERDTWKSKMISKVMEFCRSSTQAGRYEVEQGGLGVLVHVHHKDGQQEPGKIC